MRRVVVKHMQEEVEIEVEEKETLESLKKKISERVQILPNRQKLTYEGRALQEPGKTIEELKIKDGGVIYANRIEAQSGPKEILEPIQSKKESRPEANIMKDPTMKKIMSNPEVMKKVLEMCPEMKKQDPELRKLMESNQMLEEIAKFAEDPEYMNTQMKSIDIAMAKLETVPGGFSMLKNMMKMQKDPNSGLAEGADSTVFKEGAVEQGQEGQPAPNPWGGLSFNPMVEYRGQMQYMKECGFKDSGANIRMLVKHQGDVDQAIIELVHTGVMQTPAGENESEV